MYKHEEIVERHRAEQRIPTWDALPWGWRRELSPGPDIPLSIEVLAPRTRCPTRTVVKGSLLLFVIKGVLWVRTSAAKSQFLPGQVVRPERGVGFELAATEQTTVLVIQSAATKIETAVDREPRSAKRLPAAPPEPTFDPPDPAPPPAARRPQPPPEERAAIANAAQGLARALPAIGEPRSAADVQFGFAQHGFNLRPVLPET